MSERSSEKNRLTRRSSEAEEIPPVEPTDAIDTSGSVEDEVGEIVAGQFEASAPLRFLLRSFLIRYREEINAAPAQAHDRQAGSNSNDAPIGKETPWGSNYWDPSKTSLPDYGPSLPAQVKSTKGPDMRLQPDNGVRPINRLANPPPVRSQNPYGQGTSPFDSVTAKTIHREKENSRKRQRVEGSSANGSSSIVPIELDDSPYIQIQRAPSSVRSGHSRDFNGQERFASSQKDGGVKEYRQVEKTLKAGKPRSRNGCHSENASTINRDPQRFRRDGVMEVAKENSKDPISDDELEILYPRKKSTIQVQSQARSEHQSISHLDPSRQGEKSFATPRRDTDEFSKHFPGTHSRDCLAYASAGGPQRAPNSSRGRKYLSKQDNHDSEVDELANDPHFEKAKALLINHRNKKKLPATPNRKQKLPPAERCSSSDEYTPIKAGDIEPTLFTSARGKSLDHAAQMYKIFQFFAPGHNWLISDHDKKWSLYQDCEAAVLAIRTESDLEFDELRMNLRSIHKLEWSRDSSKVRIFKSQDQSAQGASNIHIEFEDYDEAAAFVEHTNKHGHCIDTPHKESGYLDKVFTAAKSKPESRKQRPEKAEDLKLMENKSCARHAAQIKQQRPNGSRGPANRLIDGFSENPDQPNEIPGDRRSVRDLAGPDVAEEGLQQRRNNEGTPAASYRNSDHAETRQPLLRGTRSSQRMAGNRSSLPRLGSRQSQRQRMRSPSPFRWTENNPGWQAEYWHNNVSVIYPREGKNKASVDRKDIERLDEGEFLNDNLIIFYLRWLEHRLAEERPDLVDRIYFHNTFFYERLTKPGKGKVDGINYDAVARWTAKVDLLKYDYIVVPVNETAHWYVAIICNAPKLLENGTGAKESSLQANAEDGGDNDQAGVGSRGIPTLHQIVNQSPTCELLEVIDSEMRDVTLDDKQTESPAVENCYVQSFASLNMVTVAPEATQVDIGEISPVDIVSDIRPDATKANNVKKAKRKSTPAPRKYDPEEPRIITLDSLGITHSPTCTNLKKYLMQEIKAKKGIEIDDPGGLGLTAKGIPLQDNHCDCGLFLLIYIEQFLKSPDDFVRNILQRDPVRSHVSISIDATENWSEWPRASKMRDDIRDLLFELQKEQAEAAKKLKVQAKAKLAKAGTDTVYSSRSKLAFREESRSAHASPAKVHIPLEDTEHLGPAKLRKRQKTRRASPDAQQLPLEDTRHLPGEPNSKAAEALSEGVASSFLNVIRPDHNDNVVPASDHGKSLPDYVTIPDDTQDNGGSKPKAFELSSHTHGLEAQTGKDRSVRGQSLGRSENAQDNDLVEIPDPQEIPYRFLHHPLPNSSSFRSPTPEQESPVFNFAEAFAHGSEEEQMTGYKPISKEHSGDLVAAEEDVVDLVHTTPSKSINALVMDDAADDQDMLLTNAVPPDAAYLSSPRSYTSSQQLTYHADRQVQDQTSWHSSPTVKKLQREGAHTEVRTNNKRKRFECLEESSRKTRKGFHVLDPSDKKIVER
ncbi:Ulp1 protease family protein [Diplocarpon rosae]|nr:Ulp1 protease family protein [Diplocarpon rosae]